MWPSRRLDASKMISSWCWATLAGTTTTSAAFEKIEDFAVSLPFQITKIFHTKSGQTRNTVRRDLKGIETGIAVYVFCVCENLRQISSRHY